MKKQLKNLSYLMILFTFLTSTLSADEITSINAPHTLYKGAKIACSVDYQTQDKDLIFTLQDSDAPWTIYYYQRLSANESGKEVAFIIPDNIPTDTPVVYQAFLTPKGKGWDDSSIAVIDDNIIVKEEGELETIRGIYASTIITKGEEATISVDYQTQDQDLIVTLQDRNAPWTIYYYKRLSANESGKKLTFIIPDNIPTDTPVVYQAFLTPKGKGWDDSSIAVIDDNIIVKEEGEFETIRGIYASTIITKGEEATISVDYQTQDQDLIVTLQDRNAPWTIYYYQRLSANESGKKLSFIVPNNIPTDTSVVYQAFLTPKGKGWNDRSIAVLENNIIVKEVGVPTNY